MRSGEKPEPHIDVLDSDTEYEAPTGISKEKVGGVAK